MKRVSVVLAALALAAFGVAAQGKPTLVINAFTAGEGVTLPYDLKLLQTQLVAEFKVLLKDFEIVAEAPKGASGSVYTLDAVITGWRPGNAAKRLLIGAGSGRESSDIAYTATDASGKKAVDQKDTIRTNFYSQGSGSSGTLAHPIAQKIADAIKKAKLR